MTQLELFSFARFSCQHCTFVLFCDRQLLLDCGIGDKLDSNTGSPVSRAHLPQVPCVGILCIAVDLVSLVNVLLHSTVS